MPPVIDPRQCVACGTCERSCPLDVIHTDGQTGKPEIRYADECWMCGSCRQVCPRKAITLRFPLNTILSAGSNPYL